MDRRTRTADRCFILTSPSNDSHESQSSHYSNANTTAGGNDNRSWKNACRTGIEALTNIQKILSRDAFKYNDQRPTILPLPSDRQTLRVVSSRGSSGRYEKSRSNRHHWNCVFACCCPATRERGECRSAVTEPSGSVQILLDVPQSESEKKNVKKRKINKIEIGSKTDYLFFSRTAFLCFFLDIVIAAY